MSHYLTNKLIGSRPLPDRQALRSPSVDFVPSGTKHHPVLIRLSTGYPGVRGTLPALYSPFRHSYASPYGKAYPFDLHVSTTPPAFALSQDQTLQLESVDHKLRLIAKLTNESVLVFFNTPLGRAGHFRPAPPDLPARQSSRRSLGTLGHTPALLGLELFTCKRALGPWRPVSRRGIIQALESLSITHPGKFRFTCFSLGGMDRCRDLTSRHHLLRLASFCTIHYAPCPVKMILSRIPPEHRPRVTTCSYSTYERPHPWGRPRPPSLFRSSLGFSASAAGKTAHRATRWLSRPAGPR